MAINREWHLKHKMLKNPTDEQRMAWHIAHAIHCDCRPAPEWILKIIKRQKKTSPARTEHVMATATTDLLSLYKAPAKAPELVTVPLTKYLMIDGTGDPNTSAAFQSAIETLYGLAYTIKFGRKKRGLKSDYKITPLEGLWWSDDTNAFVSGDKSKWKWTLMLAQPEFIMSRDVAAATKELTEKKDLPLLPQVRFERYKEGKSVQIMHVGPYSAEGPTIERLHKYASDHGLALRGKHHEIYLGATHAGRDQTG